MHEPLQDRSRRTLESIIDATEALLERRRFEDISIAEIIAKAGASTGSFYARFPSKDALLPALYARYDAQIPDRVARTRRAFERRAHTLAETCRYVIDEIAASFEERQNLMRAITLYARTRPAELKPILGTRAGLHQQIIDSFKPFHGEIRHRDREAALRAGLFVVGTAIREAVLFPDAPFAAVSRQSTTRLKGTLAAMLVSYLTSDGEGEE